MNFDLSEEQVALQDSVARMLGTELGTTRLLQIIDSEDGFDPDLWQTLTSLGIAGITVDEENGGVGLGMLEAALVAEVCGYHACPGPWLAHLVASLAIVEGGNLDTKARWLPRLASGESIATLALAESDGCWMPEQWKLAATNAITGGKRNVLHPRQADVAVVGLLGGDLGLVEMDDDVEVHDSMTTDATRRLAHVQFNACVCEPLNVSADRIRDALLILIAADAFGGAKRCLDMAVEYSKTREQFGQTIAHFQALKHQLANVAVDIEPARGLYWYAAHAFDIGAPDLMRMAALSKAHIADRFVASGRECLQVHGGIGYTWEYPLHIWLKRAIFDQAYMGNSRLHRTRVAHLSDWWWPGS